MIRFSRDARGTLWSPDRTVSIRTRYKDSPRGGLGTVVEDFQVSDHLFEHRHNYELTMSRARAAAAYLISKHPVIEWSAWDRDSDGVHSCASLDGLVRVSVDPMSHDDWRAVQVAVETPTRPLTYRWRVPGSLTVSKAQVRAWGAKHWHQEIGATA